MSKSKRDLNINFKGKKGELVIKLNGKVIYPYQEKESKKEINPNKLRTQLKTGVAAVFSGGVNKIMPLRYTWNRWPVKSRVAYRNILSANIKRCTAEHPTIANMICPLSGHDLLELAVVIDKEGIKFESAPLAKMIDNYENEDMITVAGILSVYSPRAKKTETFSIYPLSMEIKDFVPTENICGKFSFSAEMLKNISDYEKCILYFTIVMGKVTGRNKRWFNSSAMEYLLLNNAEGKFKRGELAGLHK